MEFESKLLSQSVIVIDNFRYECLLGKDFLIANKMAVDNGKMTLKFPDGFEVPFTSTQNQTATLISDLRISPKTTVTKQTSIKNADSDLPLITDGGFLASNKLFVPKIVTKVRNRSNRVTLQVTNITDQSVFIKAGTKIADLKPFREFSRATPTFFFDNNKVNINKVEVKMPTSVITEEDLAISHLSAEQKAELVETINDVGLTAEPVLGKVTEETLNALGGSKYFITLDLQSGYWQVPLDEKSKEITAFSTMKGHFEFNVLPFGLSNAALTFQRLMDYVLSSLHWSQCLVYLDDVIIFRSSFSEHLERLKTVLTRLKEAGLTLKFLKCQWAKSEVKFLGHLITDKGIKPDPSKTEAVQNFPVPTSKAEVRAFLGLCSYYCRFIKNFASVAKPLTILTRTRGNPNFKWSKEAQEAFDYLKSTLLQPPILKCPNFKLPFILGTDASNLGLGGVLSQVQDGVEVAIGYASHQLRPGEEKYPPIQKECLAVVWGIRYFHQYLYGQPNFDVITDNCPLKWLRSMFPNNRMLQCWVCHIQQYSFTVKHWAGKLHGNADGFSRCPITSSLESEEDCCSGWITVNAISTEEIGELQDGDPYLRAMKEYLTEKVLPKEENLSNRVKAYHERYELHDKVLYHIWIPKCKQSKGRTRKQLVVPPRERGKLLVHHHHDVGHPGFQRTLARLQENYFWV